MSLKIAVQMDPIQRINIKGDSTFALLLEAQKRGHQLSYYTPDRLALLNGRVFAHIESLSVRDKAGDHFTLDKPRRQGPSEFDLELVPPASAYLLPVAPAPPPTPPGTIPNPWGPKP